MRIYSSPPRSYSLLWQYLLLLVKQNGKLRPDDLAALLLASCLPDAQPVSFLEKCYPFPH